MLRGASLCPSVGAMEKSAVRWAERGEFSLLVASLPAEICKDGEATICYAIPMSSRRGGLLLALPLEALDADNLAAAMTTEDEGLLGPSRSFLSPLVAEDEENAVVQIGVNCRYMVVDFTDEILGFLKEFVPEEDEDIPTMPFSVEHSHALPSMENIAAQVREWALAQNVGRAHFYSAREEPEPLPKTAATKKAAKRPTTTALMEQISALSAQVQMLAAQQTPVATGQPDGGVSATPAPEQKGGGVLGVGVKMPAVSSTLMDPRFQTPPSSAVAKALALVGPPPRVQATPTLPGFPIIKEDEPKNWKEAGFSTSDPILSAISQQGSALTALVAHLTSASDPLGDLSSMPSSSQGGGTRGVQRRERLQSELAAGSSTNFLQMMQQLHRKMFPGRVVPKTVEDLKIAGVSMHAYLEKYGGYRNQRDSGLIMWLLAYVVDALAQGDVHRAQEHLALTVVGLEQASLDNSWSLAYLLTLADDPPNQLFQDRMACLHNQGRPFGALCPATWAAVALSYLKELEVLGTKKQETKGKEQKVGGQQDGDSPSPKRRLRFPKKPKDTPKAE